MGKKRPIEFEVAANGCFETINRKKNPWGYVYISDNGRTKMLHRFIYEQLIGPIPEGLVIRHTCDNPGCINIEHLLMGTQLENIQDRQDRNRQARGSRMNTSKLSDSEVLEIVDLLRIKGCEEIGKAYNVSNQTISGINTGLYWSHLTGKTKKLRGEGRKS